MFSRRDLLAFGAMSLLRKCGSRNFDASDINLRPSWGVHDPESIEYVRGPHRISLGVPRVVAVAAPDQHAHFPGLHVFPTGEVLLHYPTIPDTDKIPGISRYVISTDRGKKFDDWWNGYFVEGNHTSAEPLVMCDDGVLRGGSFDPRQFNHPGGDKRRLTVPLQTVSNGGRTTTLTMDAITISGFPADIGEFSPGVIGCSWFGKIIRLTKTHWLSSVLPKFAGQTRTWPQCIETWDGGFTWYVIGQIAGDYWDEGLSEGTMILVKSGKYAGRLVFYSRIGVGPIARAYSDDLGHNWTLETIGHMKPYAATGVNAWCKAPYASELATGDFVITAGFVGPENSEPWVHGYAPAQMGLYVSSDPMANGWPVVDLAEHHNRTMPDSLKFGPKNKSTGYMVHQALVGSGDNLLICYDRDYSTDGSPNMIFVVDAHIARN